MNQETRTVRLTSQAPTEQEKVPQSDPRVKIVGIGFLGLAAPGKTVMETFDEAGIRPPQVDQTVRVNTEVIKGDELRRRILQENDTVTVTNNVKAG